ncbi:hypothetical protein ACIQV3_01395 [Streptomyces sp. NPDC099050]
MVDLAQAYAIVAGAGLPGAVPEEPVFIPVERRGGHQVGLALELEQ